MCKKRRHSHVATPLTTGVLQGDVLAPFLFIIVIDNVSKRSAGDFGYLTHKGNNQDKSGRAVRSTTRLPDYKVKDLAFADDIALLENDSTRAQRQLDKLEHEAKKVDGYSVFLGKTFDETLCFNVRFHKIRSRALKSSVGPCSEKTIVSQSVSSDHGQS